MPNQPINKDAEATLKALEAGGLPPEAMARLQENAAKQNTPSQYFTSNLSVNELLLTRECGYEPLGQVMGASVYQTMTYIRSDPRTGAPTSGEVFSLSDAYYQARKIAFGRLLQEASILKADGVLGVRFSWLKNENMADCIEFNVVGTAVRSTGGFSSKSGAPFLSNLNGQEHWSLRQGGLKPVGFVFGNCCWHPYLTQAERSIVSTIGGVGTPNVEFPTYTTAIYEARERAMNHLNDEARALQAKGVVGVSTDTNIWYLDGQPTGPMIIHFTVFGTAVAKDPLIENNFKVQQTISLND